MTYRIVSDSSSNVFSIQGSTEYVTVPFKILIDDREYIDTPELDVADMVERMGLSRNKTGSACPNIHEWLDAYEGADNIFAITISSELSGSFSSAKQAADEYMTENPGTKVHVINSLSTGGEMLLIIEKLKEYIESGLLFEDIRAKVEGYMKHTHLLFALESLENLAKNGRVNPAIAKLAGFLGIRFLGVAGSEGVIHQAQICKGTKRTISAIYNEMIKRGYKGGKVRISHCLNPDAAESLLQKIKSVFEKADVSVIPCTGLCSCYAEAGGMIIGFEDIE
ncbi:MAG: DegV family protein [Lachnospiraceae bacterium]|nr:DegV family protein [Lachnospiraceae bacterium]